MSDENSSTKSRAWFIAVVGFACGFAAKFFLLPFNKADKQVAPAVTLEVDSNTVSRDTVTSPRTETESTQRPPSTSIMLDEIGCIARLNTPMGSITYDFNKNVVYIAGAKPDSVLDRRPISMNLLPKRMQDFGAELLQSLPVTCNKSDKKWERPLAKPLRSSVQA